MDEFVRPLPFRAISSAFEGLAAEQPHYSPQVVSVLSKAPSPRTYEPLIVWALPIRIYRLDTNQQPAAIGQALPGFSRGDGNYGAPHDPQGRIGK